MDNENFYYCDRCKCPIDNRLIPKDMTSTYSLCSECALELFQKIFGDQEADRQ